MDLACLAEMVINGPRKRSGARHSLADGNAGVGALQHLAGHPRAPCRNRFVLTEHRSLRCSLPRVHWRGDLHLRFTHCALRPSPTQDFQRLPNRSVPQVPMVEEGPRSANWINGCAFIVGDRMQENKRCMSCYSMLQAPFLPEARWTYTRTS